ncbi:uncharacterized protein [Pyrus communis]|uniref:uncharacterized protein n=1 Tax=Pyrus communis TaxID=23211 RepID=UPI0035BF0617
MAKKKVTLQPNDTKEVTHHSKTHHITHKAAAAAAMDEPSEKLENLKSLNSLLLKETKDRRQQVESLVQAKAGLESELSRFLVESESLVSELSEKSEENVGLELEKTVYGVFVLAQMGQMMRERVEIERAMSERDGEIVELKREVEELAGGLEIEKGKLSRVCWERDCVKRDFSDLSEEANGLKLKVVEMEKKERVFGEEFQKLKVHCNGLVQDKAGKEREVEIAMREKELAEMKRDESERVIDDLKREIERVVMEKSRHEARIFQLENEAGQLSKIELGLRKENAVLHVKVLELEKSVEEATGKGEVLEREIKVLGEEKREKEQSFKKLTEEVKSQKELLDTVTEELKKKEERIKEIKLKKNEIKEAKVRQKKEIAELTSQVKEERDFVSTLRNSCDEQKEKNVQLVSEVSRYKDALDRVTQEKAEALKNLEGEKKQVEDLMLTILGREKTIKEIEKELEKLRSVRENIAEKNKAMESRLESLVKEKDVLQKNLVEAQTKTRDWEAKFESEGTKMELALTLLKNTAARVSLKSEGKEEVATNDPKVGEEIKPYAVELDAIQTAFRNKEKMVGDLQKQLESMQKSSEAQKKKSFWTLISSATTLIAAASFAYVSKAR